MRRCNGGFLITSILSERCAAFVLFFLFSNSHWNPSKAWAHKQNHKSMFPSLDWGPAKCKIRQGNRIVRRDNLPCHSFWHRFVNMSNIFIRSGCGVNFRVWQHFSIRKTKDDDGGLRDDVIIMLKRFSPLGDFMGPAKRSIHQKVF